MAAFGLKHKQPQEVFYKKGKISQNSREPARVGVSFLSTLQISLKPVT